MGVDLAPATGAGSKAATVLCSLLFLAAGAAGNLVHNHHHLLGDGSEDRHGGYLEVDAQNTAQTSGNGPPACVAEPHPLEQAILSGERKAYAFGGIPENCGDGYGCQSGYWGEWCRYRHKGPPQCPEEVKQDLQSRLIKAAGDGHSWARELLLVRPCEVFPYLEGRTLWIIGDSMSKDFAFAFQCFMLEYWDLADTGRWPTNQSTSPNVSADPAVMQDVFTALGKLDPDSSSRPWFLQWCVPMYGDTRMCFLRANEGSFMAENLLPLLPRLTAPHDIVLVNFGLHSNDDGSLRGYIKELEAFASKYKELESQLPQFVWRQTSTQHFDSLLGEWFPNKPMTEQRCAPIRGLELKPDGSLGPDGDPTLDGQKASDMTDARETLMRGGRRNIRSAYVMGKLGIPIMQIWNHTVPFWDFHRYYHDPEGGGACAKINCDCTHTCFPSWHQMWMASFRDIMARVGRKGDPKLEDWGQPLNFPVPGINVPQEFIPHLHWPPKDDTSNGENDQASR